MGFKVLTAELFHETNTFSRYPAGLDAFRNRYILFGGEAIKERGTANTEIAGFLDAGRKYSWDVEHVLSAAAGPSGRVTREAFDWLCAPIIAALDQARFDGILLGLHGAMVTEEFEDGDGELLRRLRAKAGPEIPIAVTLDPHANVSRQMCESANILVSFKTYPHVDMRDTARQAGGILHRTMAGEIRPRTILAKRPMLEEVNGGRTDIGPMKERIEVAIAYENEAGVFAVSVNAGFASADILEVGPTVLVTAEGGMTTHQAFAEQLADDIWTRRHDVLNDYLSVEDVAEIAASYEAADGPLIIADYADNPGGGAYGDSTNLLQAMLDAGLANACLGPMIDRQTALFLHSCWIGDFVDIKLGGHTDPQFGGGPLALKVELVSVSDGRFVGDGPILGGLHGSFGPSAVVRSSGIDILVASIAQQILDLQQFRAFGINPEEKRVVALKSMQHFRAAFEPVAGKILVCDSGALCTPRYDRLNYSRVPRPVFPLDPDTAFFPVAAP